MAMNLENRSTRTKHSFLLFTILLILLSGIVMYYGILVVLGIAIVLLLLISFLHAAEIIPGSIAKDIPAHALFFIFPFALAYLVLTLGETQNDVQHRLLGIGGGYLFVLLICIYCIVTGKKDEEAMRLDSQHRLATATLRDTSSVLEYLRDGHLDTDTFHEELKRYRKLVEKENQHPDPELLGKIIVSMQQFHENIKRTARAAEPKITAHFVIDRDLKDSQWSLVSVKLGNIGAVNARNIAVMLDGTLEVHREKQTLKELARGEERFVRFQLRPLGHGQLLVSVVVEVHSAVEDLDAYDWKWRYVYEFTFNVKENDDRTIEQLNVQGDFVEGSKVNIQDSVVTRSKVVAEEHLPRPGWSRKGSSRAHSDDKDWG